MLQKNREIQTYFDKISLKTRKYSVGSKKYTHKKSWFCKLLCLLLPHAVDEKIQHPIDRMLHVGVSPGIQGNRHEQFFRNPIREKRLKFTLNSISRVFVRT